VSNTANQKGVAPGRASVEGIMPPLIGRGIGDGVNAIYTCAAISCESLSSSTIDPQCRDTIARREASPARRRTIGD
jgi:hypothetical protein